MEKQDSFDEIMRAKFAKRELPLDEANWEDIKKMTDAAREKKKRRRIGFIFFIGLMCGVIGMLPFIIKLNSEKTVTVDKTKLTEVKGTKAIAPAETIRTKQETKSKVKEVRETKNTEEADKPALTENKTGANEKEQNVIKEQQKAKATNAVLAANAVPVKKEKTTAIVLPETKKEETKNKKQTAGDKKENSSVVENTVTKPLVADKEKAAPTNIAVETKANEESKKSIAKNENKIEHVAANDVKKPEGEKEIVTESKIGEVSENKTKQVEVVTNKENKTNEPAAVKNNLTAFTENAAQAKDTITETPKTNTESVTAKADSVNKKADVIAKDTASKKDSTIVKANPWTLSPVLVIGGGYGVQTTGGLEVTRALSKYWNVGAGLYYMYYLGAIDGNTARTFSNTNYDFGSSNNTLKISVSKFHYAMLNAFIEFKINKRNALVAGANLFYLVTTSNRITQYVAGHPNQYQDYKTYGYTNELSPLVVGIMGGYRRKIFGGLDIGLYINYGLTSMIDKKYVTHDYYNSDGHYQGLQYNTSVQLELKYNLFRKVKK